MPMLPMWQQLDTLIKMLNHCFSAAHTLSWELAAGIHLPICNHQQQEGSTAGISRASLFLPILSKVQVCWHKAVQLFDYFFSREWQQGGMILLPLQLCGCCSHRTACSCWCFLTLPTKRCFRESTLPFAHRLQLPQPASNARQQVPSWSHCVLTFSCAQS